MNKEQKEIIDKIQKEKWTLVVERPICTFIRGLIREGQFSESFNKALGSEIPPIGDANVKDYVFSSVESIENTKKAIQKRINLEGYSGVRDIFNSCIKTAKELHDSIKNKKSGSLVEQFKDIRSKYTALTAYLLVVVFSERLLEQKIEELIKNKTGKFDQHYFDNLVHVKRFTENTNELIDIIELAREVKIQKLDFNSEKVDKLVKKHVKEYGWLATRWFFEESWNEKDIKNRLEGYLTKNLDQELNNITKPREDAEKITKEFIKKYKLSKEEKDLITLVKDFVYLRTFRTESTSRANCLLKPIMNKISEKIRVSFKDILELMPEEVLDLIGGKKLDAGKIIAERKKGYCMILYDDKIATYTGEDLKAVESLPIFKIEKQEINELRGMVAWKGIAHGKVKVIRLSGELSKVQKGDIIVSIMTTPDFVPAMEKAAAFVTDEGGILCHAAIIAREMQKPCIIGTKNATRFLKDGDLVEVDANTGFVRILERAK